ncbi:hypothetical protein SUGI_0265600 [Cryptomeria japonica]|nr:hypothetical protein SUGI_0265600 [Cryptomeria japonica]
MTDDASVEIEAIRSSFNCRILLCIWHVRRAWLKNVYRYVNNKDIATNSCVQLEDQDVSGVVIGEVQRTDSCVQLEDQDVSGVVIGEDQRTGCRKKKKKKVTNHSGIAIQEESLIIMQQQSLDDQANTRRHRLPFSIDLNQTITDEIDHIDDKICGDQPSMANVIPTQTFQQANPVLNDQQIHEEHMLPFPTDLNQTTTMDAMQTRDALNDREKNDELNFNQ